MTAIPWADATWNVVTGCSPVSEGCEHCWAARMASGRLKNHPAYKGLACNGKWTGEVRLNHQWLSKPLHWRKPRTVFVCSTGDLFHSKVPHEFIEQVFGIIAKRPEHTFQLLTKRVAQMLPWGLKYGRNFGNVCWGVTAENQKRLDERVPVSLQIPAAVRYVCLEPLLGGIDLDGYLGRDIRITDDATGDGAQWVIVGCESGPDRRPCKIEWVRDIVQQCKDAEVPVFVKALDIHGKVRHNPQDWPEDLRIREMPDV